MNALWDWLDANQTLLLWLGLGSLAMFVASLLLLPLVVARLPADYFHPRRDGHRWRQAHPLAGAALAVVKNAIGVLFIVAGVLMLVLPGQGLLTILVGLSLTDFPGKRDWERRLVRQPAVLTALNWLRRRAGKAELELGQS